MPLTLTRNQVREVDRIAIAEYGVSGLVLMENAGRGTADVLSTLIGGPAAVKGPVIIVCGKGNNGGDGFVIARHLDLRGYPVKVVLLCDPAQLRGDAQTNYAILTKLGVPIISDSAAANLSAHFDGAAYLVDAVLGTGATGEPKFPFDVAIDAMNSSGIPILAVDLPSGLDCDTGVPAAHTIRAAHTCTFVAAKCGLLAASAAPYVGQIHVCDIGVPQHLAKKAVPNPS